MENVSEHDEYTCLQCGCIISVDSGDALRFGVRKKGDVFVSTAAEFSILSQVSHPKKHRDENPVVGYSVTFIAYKNGLEGDSLRAAALTL